MSNHRLNKKDIAGHVASQTGLGYKMALSIVNDIIEEIQSALKEGKTVNILRFGRFQQKKKKSRLGLNPRTKEKVIIAERYCCQFKASKILQQGIKNASL